MINRMNEQCSAMVDRTDKDYSAMLVMMSEDYCAIVERIHEQFSAMLVRMHEEFSAILVRMNEECSAMLDQINWECIIRKIDFYHVGTLMGTPFWQLLSLYFFLSIQQYQSQLYFSFSSHKYTIQNMEQKHLFTTTKGQIISIGYTKHETVHNVDGGVDAIMHYANLASSRRGEIR